MWKRSPIPEAPQAPEARTVNARVVNDGGTVEAIPAESLVFDPSLYRSPVECESSRRWFFAVTRGHDIPFTPSVFRRADGRYSVLGWVSK